MIIHLPAPDLGLKVEQLQLLLEILSAMGGGKVWIFGSRARGDYRPHSDIDLMLEAVPPVSQNMLGRLSDSLEESLLPFKVDLVTPETLLPAYREGVHAEKKLLAELP